MALVRWEPVGELQSLQQEMNRLFGSFFDSPTPPRGNGASGRWIPAMDLIERDEQYVLRADLPGLDTDDVKIELEENVLTISGQRHETREHEVEGYHRIERASGAFSRSLTLPAGVNTDRIEASFANGVLEVHIPKPEERKPRRVAIGVADRPATVEGSASAPSADDASA
jgi:HSP20 family protein